MLYPIIAPHLVQYLFIVLFHRSLLDIFTAADRVQSQKRLDFSGRLCTPSGQIAKLYPNLGLKDVNSRTENEVK